MATDDIDEALEETFPASDAPANTVETGIGAPRQTDESTAGDERAPLEDEPTTDTHQR